jgi:hypothetical protein
MTWWQKKPFIDVIEGYDKISVREQRIVLVTISVVLILLGYLLAIEPLLLSNKAMFDEQASILNVNNSLAAQIQKTREKQYQDPNDPLREKLIVIRREGESLQQKN